MDMEMNEIGMFHGLKYAFEVGGLRFVLLSQDLRQNLLTYSSPPLTSNLIPQTMFLLPPTSNLTPRTFSLPFNGAGWFGADIIDDPVDTSHLINDPVGNMLQDPVR
jgi:hypothetical protein